MSRYLSPTVHGKLTETISQFGDNEQQVVAEVPEKRKCTNVSFLIAFSVCFLVVIPFSIICSMGSDINRFFYGYDKYGNTCGVKNKPIAGINCSGQDMTEKPIALLRYCSINRYCIFSKKRIVPDQCIESCNPPNQLLFHRCYPAEDVDLDNYSSNFKQMTEILHVISKSASTILAMSLSALVLSFTIFFCLRCHTAVTFWSILIMQLIVSITATAYFWHKYAMDEDKSVLYILSAVGAMAYVIFLILFILILRENLTLVFGIYEEALNAIFKMPMILLQPILTLSTLLTLITSIIFLILLICSNECLQQTKQNSFSYANVPNVTALLYSGYLAFLILWIFAFVEGCLAMVVSGAVSRYYFTSDKLILQRPLRTSFYILTRYHLGTVAYGSLVVTLFLFMRSIAVYMMRKVYIQTAIHGEAFCKSSIRAFRLLCLNLVHTITISAFNYIITYGFSFLVVILTVGVGMWMNLVSFSSSSQENSFTYYARMGILFGAGCAGAVAIFVIRVLNIATETTFFCFCEEQLANDGNTNPTYMTPELVKIIRRAKELRRIRLTEN